MHQYGCSRVLAICRSMMARRLLQLRFSYQYLPIRLASRGFISKISTPCIFPRISKRSRPVACSRSVGTVPGAAPGGRRSASLLISVSRHLVSNMPQRSHDREPGDVGQGSPVEGVEISTIKGQDFAFRIAWFGIIFRGFGYLVLGTWLIERLSACRCSLAVHLK